MGISVLGTSVLSFSLNQSEGDGVIIINLLHFFLFPVIWEVEKFEIQNMNCKV